MQTKKWNSQLYNENSQLQYKAGKRFFDEISLKGNEIVLDIGCGTGVLTNVITKRVPDGKVIGIDSSKNMISFAKGHYSQPNLKFILMQAEELNFPFAFDVIVSSFCVQWIKNKQVFFKKIASYLKQDGSAHIIMPFRHQDISKIRSKLMVEAKWSQYFNIKDAQELLVFENKYKSYVEESGLDNLNYQTEDVITIFENIEKFKVFLKNVTSYLDCLPTESLQDEFMQDVIDLYLQKHPSSPDGSCTVTYTYGKIRTKGLKIDQKII